MATKLVPELRGITYEERLRALPNNIGEEKRERGTNTSLQTNEWNGRSK